MGLRFLQLNTNHSPRPQDLLLQHLAEWQLDISLVSEPYFVPSDREDWIADAKGLSAIIAPGLPLECRGILLVAVYLPPRRSAAAVEAGLDRLSAVLRQSSLPALIGGDFNAKSTAWGEDATDTRGELVLEWATASGLVVLNVGRVPTCVRPQGESIVDLTFASPSLASRVSGWQVLAESESFFRPPEHPV
ncbi:hypothetical protein ABMA28_005652 [Loxostege sticticalis]|uniref:Endonuclease/exonuclease/phosphatase domain-containing protein n=1 Tax=Loxostege sticticalis TaxID=481309 RepID=A0ABD0SPK0_LOXSC